MLFVVLVVVAVVIVLNGPLIKFVVRTPNGSGLVLNWQYDF